MLVKLGRIVLFMTILSLSVSSGAGAQEDLIFHLPFDGSLEATVASGGPSAVDLTKQMQYVEGKVGQGAYFESGLLFYQARGNFNPQEGTMMFWLRPANWSSGNNQVHNLVDIRELLYHFYIGKGWSRTIAPESLYFSLGGFGMSKEEGGSGIAIPTTGIFTAGEWVHIAATWSFQERSISFYINGERVGTKGIAPTEKAKAWEVPGEARIRIGGSASPHVDATFDEFRIYRRALNRKEIAQTAGIQN